MRKMEMIKKILLYDMVKGLIEEKGDDQNYEQ